MGQKAAAVPADPGASAASVRRRVGSAAAVVVAAILVFGGIATWSVWDAERDRAERRDRRAAERTALALSEAIETNLSRLRGAGALAADGAVTDDEFRVFASDVLPGSTFAALALVEPVREADRAGFERARYRDPRHRWRRGARAR